MKRTLVITAALAITGLLLISENASARVVVGGGFRGVGFRGGFVGAGIRPGFGAGPRLGYRPWYGAGRGYGLGLGLAAGGAALAIGYPYNGWYPYEGYESAGYPYAGYGLEDGGCYRKLTWVRTIYYGLQQAWVTQCY
jgi:hypothetical protein